MKKFSILVVVKDAKPIQAMLHDRSHVQLHVVHNVEQSIEEMMAHNIDVVLFESAGDFDAQRKLKMMLQFTQPNAQYIEYVPVNIKVLPIDLEMAFEKINAHDSGHHFFDTSLT